MSGRYLLDTNIIIDLFNGDDAVTKKLLHLMRSLFQI